MCTASPKFKLETEQVKLASGIDHLVLVSKNQVVIQVYKGL